MKNNFRYGLRRALKVLSLGAASALFQACYGPMQSAEGVLIKGLVTTTEKQPVKDIKVLVDEYGYYYCTDEAGGFELWVMQGETLTFTFVDTDGEENGGEFETRSEQVKVDDASPDVINLEVELTPRGAD